MSIPTKLTIVLFIAGFIILNLETAMATKGVGPGLLVTMRCVYVAAVILTIILIVTRHRQKGSKKRTKNDDGLGVDK